MALQHAQMGVVLHLASVLVDKDDPVTIGASFVQLHIAVVEIAVFISPLAQQCLIENDVLVGEEGVEGIGGRASPHQKKKTDGPREQKHIKQGKVSTA